MQTLPMKLITALAFTTALLLQGCGWHLRGSQPLPAELQTLSLETANKNSEFTRSLKRSLKSLDVTLVETLADAPYQLQVSDIKESKRALSITSNARVAEYEITSTLNFSVNGKEGAQLQPSTMLSTERTYLYNSNNATSAFEEEKLLRKEMQRDLIQQIIRRYRAIQPSATESENN